MRILLTTLCLALSLLATSPAAPAATSEEGGVMVDRLVAVVDDDPILWSDVDRVIGLGLVEPLPEESRGRLERRVLDGLIDQRLRLHEIARHNFATLPPDEVDRQLERLRAGFGGPDELMQRLAALGLDEAGLRQLVRRQLRVLVYIEQRLGPRVFVRLDDVRAYYDDVLAAEMATQGLDPPPLAEVREQIHDLLHERQLNREIDAWTEELRLEADVADYLDRTETELPPVVERIEE
jgi:hypothetical protein